MSEFYLVRAELRRDVPAAALADLLVPADPNARLGAAHRLIWALFSDGADRTRDFLWRETAPGQYLALSARPPVDAHKLFRLEYKPFTPVLQTGQRLGFSLRVNPVVAARPNGGRARGKRQDIVMCAMHPISKDQRPHQRAAVIERTVSTWLTQQGERNGFVPDVKRLRVEGYDQLQIPREKTDAHRKPDPIRFSVMSIEGVLIVTDPAEFLKRLTMGFGAAKAFGCGLMLIRPAPAAHDDREEDE
jgi:CRISPR system Cascade subunit CasE